MRRTLLPLIGVLFAPCVALGQESTLVPAFDNPPAAVTPRPPSVPSDELTTLRAEIRQLQERLDRVAPAMEGRTDPQPYRPVTFAQFSGELPKPAGLTADSFSQEIPCGQMNSW